MNLAGEKQNYVGLNKKSGNRVSNFLNFELLFNCYKYTLVEVQCGSITFYTSIVIFTYIHNQEFMQSKFIG